MLDVGWLISQSMSNKHKKQQHKIKLDKKNQKRLARLNRLGVRHINWRVEESSSTEKLMRFPARYA